MRSALARLLHDALLPCIFLAAVVATIAAVPVAAQDSFEPDDDALHAKGIMVNQDPQYIQDRNLHSTTDVDWIRFYAFSNAGLIPAISYMVVVSNCSVGLEVQIAVVDANGSLATPATSGPCSGSATQTLAIDFGDLMLPDGEYYIRLRDSRGAPQVGSYSVRVFTPTGNSSGRLEGTVTDFDSGQPLEDVRVLATAPADTQLFGAQETLPTGFYSIVAIPADYVLRFSKPGYTTVGPLGPFTLADQGVSPPQFSNPAMHRDVAVTGPGLTALVNTGQSASGISVRTQLTTGGAASTVTWDYKKTSPPADADYHSPIVSAPYAQAQQLDYSFGGLSCNQTYSLRATATNQTPPDAIQVLPAQNTAACPVSSPNFTPPIQLSTPFPPDVMASVPMNNGGATTTVRWLLKKTAPVADASYSQIAQQDDIVAPQTVTTTVNNPQCGSSFVLKARASNGNAPDAETPDAAFSTGACPVLAPTLGKIQLPPGSIPANTGVTASTQLDPGTALTTVTWFLKKTAPVPDASFSQVDQQGNFTSPQAVFTTIPDAACASTYLLRVIASNGIPPDAQPPDAQFVVGPCASPVLSNLRATAIGQYGATVAVDLITDHSAAAVTLAVSDGQMILGQQTFPRPDLPSTTQTVSYSPPGFTCSTEYAVVASAVNSNNSGSAGLPPYAFATSACDPPAVQSMTVTPNGLFAMILSAVVRSNGPRATAVFQRRETGSAQWIDSVPFILANSRTDQSIPPQTIDGLVCEQSYEWRVAVTNPAATSTSATQAVATGACGLIFREGFE